MKTRNSFYALSLAVMVILFATPPTAANSEDMFETMDQFDKLDQQDFQGALNKANDCTRARNFSCSEEQLRKAAKLANGSKDKQALNTATQNLQAEQQRVRAEALARAEQERQIQLAEERREEEARREEEQAEERRRMAQRDQDARESAPNHANAFMQGMQQSMNNYAAMNKIHNESMQNINRIVEEKKANERAAREQRERNERAAAEQRAEERANQRAAAERRTQDNERTRLALQQQGREREQEQARKQEQARQQEQTRQQEQARKQEQARQQEQARKQEQERKKAEAEAAKLAEQRAEKQARDQYLSAMRNGIRLGVKNCYGNYEVGGTRPNIKPEVVGCIDVHYRARCEGSPANYGGVHKNFIGGGPGCFGDTATISPKPACPANQVHVEVVDVRPGCGG